MADRISGGGGFEWDDDKARSNLEKHKVPFDYAARVFLDPDVVFVDVTRVADGETRCKAIGVVEGRLYVVVHTSRGGMRRIISARRTNLIEERAYGAI